VRCAIRADDTPTAFHAGTSRIGLSICYDLRFPGLYPASCCSCSEPPCDLLSVPAAFTHTTGMVRWELLLRARAVETSVM
jgi:nitrilase